MSEQKRQKYFGRRSGIGASPLSGQANRLPSLIGAACSANSITRYCNIADKSSHPSSSVLFTAQFRKPILGNFNLFTPILAFLTPSPLYIFMNPSVRSDYQRLNPLSVFRGSNFPALYLCASVAKNRVNSTQKFVSIRVNSRQKFPATKLKQIKPGWAKLSIFQKKNYFYEPISEHQRQSAVKSITRACSRPKPRSAGFQACWIADFSVGRG